MLVKASREGLIKGLLENIRLGGLLSLQYADDTLLFSSCDNVAFRNLKVVLMLFEKVFGMKINFNKSEFVPMNLLDGEVYEVAHILNCPTDSLPFKYLGVPIHFEKLKREDLQPVTS
jgi:hypothetical protein